MPIPNRSAAWFSRTIAFPRFPRTSSRFTRPRTGRRAVVTEVTLQTAGGVVLSLLLGLFLRLLLQTRQAGFVLGRKLAGTRGLGRGLSRARDRRLHCCFFFYFFLSQSNELLLNCSVFSMCRCEADLGSQPLT